MLACRNQLPDADRVADIRGKVQDALGTRNVELTVNAAPVDDDPSRIMPQRCACKVGVIRSWVTNKNRGASSPPHKLLLKPFQTLESAPSVCNDSGVDTPP